MTFTELKLSAAYRDAQRVLTRWLESHGPAPRPSVFSARAALAALEPRERSSLARWLAWLQVAAGSRGDLSLDTHLRRLDEALFLAYRHALQRLPATAAVAGQRRLSA
jgi:hypothetical protein